jgi:NAD(P)-dependent dehydrogenase (short-subunit alcohol dehydrogenase family)
VTLKWRDQAPQVVFISGGGSGIGLEFGRQLAQEGASIAIFNRRPGEPALIELRECAQSDQQRFLSYSADVSDATAIRDAIAAAISEIGSPDLAINSAGIQIARPFAELSADEFEQVIRINLLGSRNFVAALDSRLQPGSQVVLVASLGGIAANYSYTAYSAAKFGVLGLANALRIEYRLRGIDVSVCCPAEIETPMVAQERVDQSEISREMKAFAGTMDVGQAARLMLEGIARRDFEIIPGFRPKLTALIARWLPATMRRISDSLADKARRRD